MYCSKCGTEIRISNQEFCANCGAELSSNISNTSKSNLKKFCSQSALFDINRNYYVFKEDSLYYANGYILDENEKTIGKVERIISEFGNIVKLRELDNSISATIYKETTSVHETQVIKDSTGTVVARIKKEVISQDNPKFYLEDPIGNRWYDAQGDYMGRSYKIIDITIGKIIAEIERADTWKEIILGSTSDYRETYVLKIYESQTDRCILLGFVLSIDNVLHDEHITRDIDFHTIDNDN